jgi:predicted  nucleic acid-binding Zn-ribbon protein
VDDYTACVAALHTGPVQSKRTCPHLPACTVYERIAMTPQIRRLEKLLQNADTPPECERIQQLIDKATRDAQKANRATRQMAKQIAKIEERNRAMDAQRKIVAGAIALSHMTRDDGFNTLFTGLLKQYAEKRYWFHFPEAFTAEEIAKAEAELDAARNQTDADKAREKMKELSGQFSTEADENDGPA